MKTNLFSLWLIIICTALVQCTNNHVVDPAKSELEKLLIKHTYWEYLFDSVTFKCHDKIYPCYGIAYFEDHTCVQYAYLGRYKDSLIRHFFKYDRKKNLWKWKISEDTIIRIYPNGEISKSCVSIIKNDTIRVEIDCDKTTEDREVDFSLMIPTPHTRAINTQMFQK